MKKGSTNSGISWMIPSARKRKQIRGKIVSQKQGENSGKICSSPCPCKCDDYY